MMASEKAYCLTVEKPICKNFMTIFQNDDSFIIRYYAGSEVC